jgi:hypothetical protein
MARRVYDQFTRVAWVTTIANTSAPTVAELNAGTNLTPFVPKDGVRPGGSQNTVDQGDVTTQFEAKTVGTFGEDFELDLYRDDSADTAWNLAAVNTVGFLVIRRLTPYATAWTASQKCEVRPAQMGQKFMKNSAANENQKFTLKLAITGEPVLAATVA